MRLREILAGDRLREKDLMHYVDTDLGNGNHCSCILKSPCWDFCGKGSNGKSGRLNLDPFSKGLPLVFPLCFFLFRVMFVQCSV